jgi:hypothetical protein
MIDTAPALFPHRKKMDGSSNVLCLNCLATIPIEQNGAGEPDPGHTCDAWLSAGRDMAKRGHAA